MRTIPKVQCSEHFLFWNQGVIYCTSGHLLVESESSQNCSQWRLDALSIPHYVVKKGRPQSARHGKTEAQKEYNVAHNARKRCRKRVAGQDEQNEGVQHRFQRDQVYRESQLKRAAVTIMNRLHQESGEERAEPIPFQQYQKMAPFFLK